MDINEEQLNQYEAFIFDCDGTLADSMPMHFKAWRQALIDNGARFEFTWELFFSMAGMGTSQTVDILNERFNENLSFEKIHEKQAEYLNVYVKDVQPIDSILSIARDRGKTHPISVASGGMRKYVHKTLEAINAMHLFQVIVTQDDVKASKPKPDLFLLAAKKMGVAPEKCLVFEDSHLGIQAADAAGMGSLLVNQDLREEAGKMFT